MSDALGKPWIESAVTDLLVSHAQELPSPPRLQGRAQIVKFLTFREDTADGGQPTDRDTELWAEITDKQWVITVRITNEATNTFEDQEKRALTYYRRGFFTLKAAVAYRFVPKQTAVPGGKPKIQLSNSKSLVLDVVELSHISGGGPGAPVAANSAGLETCPAFRAWEDALSIGGQTLINKQSLMRISLESARASKASLRRSASTNSSRKGGRTLVKTSSKLSAPQPPPADLVVFHEFQDAIWGKRLKYRGPDFAFGREFGVPLDQQNILKQIEERIKAATPSQPYDPLSNQNGALSVPNDLDDLPSFATSQVYTSTPLDAHRPPSSPSGSQASHISEDEPRGSTQHVQRDADAEDDAESHHEDDDLDPGLEGTEGLESDLQLDEGPGSPIDERPRVEKDNTKATSRLGPDLDVDIEGSEFALDDDDAVAEKILSVSTQNNTAAESESLGSSQPQPRQPVVLVPDSDPLSQGHSQRRAQLRGSSPAWDCESVALSQARDAVPSPEVRRTGLLKGKQRLSPVFSSPPQPITDIARSHLDDNQTSALPNGSQRALSGSGQADSQDSAAASLPSPPPEDPNVPNLPKHLVDSHNQSNPPIANEPTSLTEPVICEQGEVPQLGDLRDVPNKQPVETFHTRPGTEQTLHGTVQPNSKKRRRSQSPSEDVPKSVPQQTSIAGDLDTQAHDTKRRRLERPVPASGDPRRPDEPVGNAEVPVEQTESRDAVSNAAETDGSRAVSSVKQGSIVHDQKAWSAPSWMDSQTKKLTKEEVSDILKKSSFSSSSTSTTKSLPKPARGQALRPKPSLPPPPTLRRQSVRPPVSPTYPPVTASQFEDANEDLASSSRMPKVERASQAHDTTVKSSRPSVPRSSTSTPTRPSTSRPLRNAAEKSSIASKENMAPPASTTATRATVAAGTAANVERNANTPVSDKVPAKPHGRDSNAQSSAPRGVNVNADDTAREPIQGEAKDSAARRLLGGFKPSISLELDEAHMFTWGMWQGSMREAEAFWKEGATE